MIRDISPGQWQSPGTAQISLVALLTALGFDPVALDSFNSDYSPTSFETINLASGFNAITNPDTVNCRGIFIIMPRGNAVTAVVKGPTGDTGLAMHPNGFFATTFPASAPPASVGITCGGAIPGVTVIFW